MSNSRTLSKMDAITLIEETMALGYESIQKIIDQEKSKVDLVKLDNEYKSKKRVLNDIEKELQRTSEELQNTNDEEGKASIYQNIEIISEKIEEKNTEITELKVLLDNATELFDIKKKESEEAYRVFKTKYDELGINDLSIEDIKKLNDNLKKHLEKKEEIRVKYFEELNEKNQRFEYILKVLFESINKEINESVVTIPDNWGENYKEYDKIKEEISDINTYSDTISLINEINDSYRRLFSEKIKETSFDDI